MPDGVRERRPRQGKIGKQPGWVRIHPQAWGKSWGQGFLEVLAACGVPPGMFQKMGDSGQREAYRRWVALVVQPLARLLAGELSVKLEAEIGIDLGGCGRTIWRAAPGLLLQW